MKKYVDNFMQYRFLLSELVKKGIKLKYRRSYLGMIWSMLEPLLTMIVLTIVFGTLYGNTDRTFPVYILTGRLLYSFFSQSTKAALKSIRQNSAMIYVLSASGTNRTDTDSYYVIWMRNDPGNNRCIFQRYGISLVCSTYAGYVYMCDFLLS